ncbi:flagellar biosynthetic protein FlhB [Mesorhizobium sp. L-8-10]|uniref:flagellar biosynthesis protein FlhB n=1 Tax=Mesorhizobium sp. L-8-10 TaxID=2744523 RepID=UPI00192752E0|nr:flagellar biosynthesis protein FlhB [Mesorhizobium sp. L-8-10]BCH30976.1 flagellar biosynthetic protein FlhB [Mesorhizobium sp. L-8-10]
MADAPDKDSKTEEATEKKIRDTIEKGQLPVSKEAPLFASFLAFLVFTLFFAYDQIVGFGAFLSIFLEKPEEWSLNSDLDASALYETVFMEIGKLLVVFIALMVTAGIAASALQNSPRMVLDRVQPKLSRISPAQGWSRIFGAQGIAEFLKSVGKLLLTVTFLALTLRGVHSTILGGMFTEPGSFGLTIRGLLIQILVTITLVMAIIAGVDLIWQRIHWRRDLRMTRQEVKDELKQSDGDPLVKARIRSVARDRARQRMILAVPKATLVIANPTHFSIALRYVRDQDAAPVVVAKGQDLVALKIREIAQENNIPVFENVELARSMYKQVSVDSMIPPQFYQAVAELIKVVYAKPAKAQRNRDLS